MRELVEADEPGAVGAHRVALCRREVADRVRHRHFVDDFPRPELPLGDGAVDEQRGVRHAVRTKLRMERSQADGDLRILDRLVFENGNRVLVVEEVAVANGRLDLLEVEDRGDAWSLPDPTMYLPSGETSTP